MSRELARDLWKWCLERNIHIQAQHLPGILNGIADAESWTMTDSTDWKPYSGGDSLMGPIEVDLFASRLTAQCPCSLLQLAARSFSTGNRCPGPGLDTHQRFCEPTLGSHGACSVTHTVPTGSSCPTCPNLKDTTMVSSVAGDASGLPTSNSTACSSDKRVGNHPSASRMAYLKE